MTTTTDQKPNEHTDLSIWDLVPYFDSYVEEIEANLECDPREYGKYQKNPKPYLTDLVRDFSDHPAMKMSAENGDQTTDQYFKRTGALVSSVLDKYLGR